MHPLLLMNEQLSRGSNLNLPQGSYQSLLCRVNIPLMETTQQGAWWVKKAANGTLQTVFSHPRASRTDQPGTLRGHQAERKMQTLPTLGHQAPAQTPSC